MTYKLDSLLKEVTPEQLSKLVDNLSSFTEVEQQQIAAVIDELERRARVKSCQNSLIEFCKHMDSSYIVAAHHKRLASLLESIAYKQKDRIAVSIPPRHGKSHLISTLFPAWFLGKFPDQKVLMVSNKSELAVDFGRKVRNLIADPKYQEIFPGISLAADSKSAGRWSTNYGGEYYATGIGGGIAGRGADLLLVDDPHDEQDILNGNFEAFEKAYQWFTFGARTRLMSGGRVAVVHCMTGDTPVLMEDGEEKPLREVRPGDVVASYDGGGLAPAKVLNWANQGSDRIYAIRTTSGKIVRANGKHPLLVDLSGVRTWTKVSDLKVGMSLIGVSQPPAVRGLSFPRSEQECSLKGPKYLGYLSAAKKAVVSLSTRLVNANTTTTKTGEKPRLYQSPTIGGSGKVSCAVLKAAGRLQKLRECATSTTRKMLMILGGGAEVEKATGTHTLNIGTGSALLNTTECLKSKTVNVLSASNPQGRTTPHQTGTESSLLTTATAESVLEPFCATTATSSLKRGTQKKYSYGLLSTYEPTLEQIVEISDAGYEDVYDIQVEGTENFIANGLVSHNTRWHMDDLIGRLVRDGANNEKADQYEVFEFPAVIETSTGQKALWPEKFDLDALERTKASMPAFQWNAQYMQSPTSEEAALIKREWWRPWEKDDPPSCEYIIMTLDAAAEKHNRADFTALATWGVFTDEKLTDGAAHLILLNVINVRVEFPELKELALREWKDWNPDSFIVEKKSAGTQLYQELRRIGIPVQEFTPGKNTGDKVARINAVADILRSGLVWYPEGRRWAEELIEQCVAFPYGSHDDLVDVTSMALARFRNGGFISLPSDAKDDPRDTYRRRVAYY